MSRSDTPPGCGFDTTFQLLPFQFMTMDQTPDFLVYERALLDGRAVVAVHVANRDAMLAARTVLDGFGAHFLNHFGRLYTEELTLWRGPEPEIPSALRR